MAHLPDVGLTAEMTFIPPLDLQTGEPVPWLKDKTRIKSLIDGILASPLFAGIALGEIDKNDTMTIVPREEAVALVPTGGETFVRFQDREGDFELWISLDLREGRGHIQLLVRGAAIAAYGDRAIDELIAVVKGAVRTLKGVAGLDYGHIKAHYHQRHFEFPRPRPPRRVGVYPEESIVTFIDSDFHASGHASATPDRIKALMAPPPPAPAVVSAEDGLFTVRWACSLDDATLKTAASEHAQWVVDRLGGDVEMYFNELGDQFDSRAGGSKRRGALTLYEADEHIGYKAVVVFPDGSYEKSAWNQAKKILKDGKLSDGAPVETMRIIVPLRDLAFAIVDEATAAGFDCVLYPDDQGRFWDPNPPGEWRIPPIRPEASRIVVPAKKSPKPKKSQKHSQKQPRKPSRKKSQKLKSAKKIKRSKTPVKTRGKASQRPKKTKKSKRNS